MAVIEETKPPYYRHIPVQNILNPFNISALFGGAGGT